MASSNYNSNVEMLLAATRRRRKTTQQATKLAMKKLKQQSTETRQEEDESGVERKSADIVIFGSDVKHECYSDEAQRGD